MLLIAVPVSNSFADDKPVMVPIAVDSAFIIDGFDSNDRTQVMINGYFPDTCYQVGPYDAYVNPRDNTVQIYQKAYLQRYVYGCYRSLPSGD